jgi:hypothetical protein
VVEKLKVLLNKVKQPIVHVLQVAKRVLNFVLDEIIHLCNFLKAYFL